MKIEPQILRRHWEAAAVEQVAERLKQEGYSVEREARFADSRADLVARKGDETLVYEFKVPGRKEADWARAAARLREQAIAQGARFRLVLVRPPRETRVEVHGIEAALEEALRAQLPQEFEALSDRTTVDQVTDVMIDVIEVRPNRIVVRGTATARLSLRDEGTNRSSGDDFPFDFKIALDPDGRLRDVLELRADTSSWLGATELPRTSLTGDERQQASEQDASAGEEQE